MSHDGIWIVYCCPPKYSYVLFTPASLERDPETVEVEYNIPLNQATVPSQVSLESPP
jgi:hypothetical protein